jgi:hypothetical protein
MSLSQTQINEAFAAMGLPAPSSAVLASLEAISNDYTALNTIIALPEVQSDVMPILAMFDLALGHDPSSATLASMVENNANNIASIANQFVESQAFANVYNGGVLLSASTVVDSSNSGIITALFVNGLGHPPTNATLQGFFGLTLGQAFLEFTQSEAISSVDNASLLGILELATGVPAEVTPPTIQNLTLTVGQDTIITGQTYDGQTVGGTDVDTAISGPLGGVFGNQPTLTPGDTIQLTSGANSLNASFDGTFLDSGLTIQGVQTVSVSNFDIFGGSVVTLFGTPGSIDDINSLTYNDSLFGNSLIVGLPTAGIDATSGAAGFNLTVENALGDGIAPFDHSVVVWFAPAALAGNTDTINVTANLVGDSLGGLSESIFHAYNIVAGSATNGFGTWDVTSEGALAAGTANVIALGANGSTAATTLNITDDGSTTIIWASFAGGSDGSADWQNLAVINAADTTGQLTISGGEFPGAGLLADDGNSINTVIGGEGADLFDLSSSDWGISGGFVVDKNGVDVTINGGGDPLGGDNIFGDAGTGVELNNGEINFISSTIASGAFEEWAGVNILYDASTETGGAVNMADFPGTLTVTLLNSESAPFDIFQIADFNVTNAPDGFTFNFNDTDQFGENFSVIGTDTTGGESNVVTINYTTVDATGTFTSENFDTVNVNVSDVNSTQTFYSGTFLDDTGAAVPVGSPDILVIGNADFTAPVGEGVTFNIEANGAFTGSGTLDIGNITSGHIGDDSITLLSGPITGLPLHPSYLDTGNLDITGNSNVIIGVTNADVIDSTTTGVFDMTSPDDANAPGTVAEWLPYDGVDVSSVSAASTLQGTLGADGTFKGLPILDAGNDVLTDLAGGSLFFGDGGSDTINTGHAVTNDGNTIVFGAFELNDVAFTQPVEGGGLAADGFWGAGPSAVGTSISGLFGGADNGGTSTDITDINGFVVGTDNLDFNVAAWGGIGPQSGQLVNGVTLDAISDASASGSTVFLGTPGETLGTGAAATTTGHVDLILDGIDNEAFANAAALAAAINTTGVGNFILGTGLEHGHEIDLLVAYYTGTQVNIADVEIQNTNGSGSITNTGASGVHVYASDILSLEGANSLATIGTTANATHIEFFHL